MEHQNPPPAIDNSAATRSLRRAGIGFVVVALIVVAWSLYSSRLAAQRLATQTEARAVLTVAVTRPEPIAGAAVLTLPGNVQAHTDAPIYARTSGYLRRWFVDIGTPVKAGQVLAEIDAPEVDQQLRGAEANLATATANEKLASTTAERWRGLRDSGAVAKQDVDQKLGEADAAKAQLQASQADLQRLRELSGFEKIVAPFDGVVTARDTDVGDLINAGGSGTALFHIADTRQLRLYVRVPQVYAAQLKPGLTATVHFPDQPDKAYAAKLERTSGSLDASSRTLLAQLVVDNAHHQLLPGAYAEVGFKLAPETGAMPFRLPANVLLAGGDGMKIATVDAADKVTLKPVTIGRDFGTDVEIIAGLAADDRVVLSPPDSLAAGTKVHVAAPAAKQP